MPWQTLLNRRDRLPANPDLGEGFRDLVAQVGHGHAVRIGGGSAGG